jgi:hypothetical protein
VSIVEIQKWAPKEDATVHKCTRCEGSFGRPSGLADVTSTLKSRMAQTLRSCPPIVFFFFFFFVIERAGQSCVSW